MNKKTKSFAVGIVAVLCFLLVFAIGFGVTGAWYQAQRQASGTVTMNQGIKLKFTNLKTLVNGDLENRLPGSLLEHVGAADVEFNSSGVPQADKNIVIPTIAQAADSVDFFVKAKVSYTYLLWSDASRTTLTGKSGTQAEGNLVGYTAADFGKGDDTFAIKTPIEFATNWKATTDGYYAYTDGTNIVKAGTDPLALFKADTDTYATLVLADWTSEFGGPSVQIGGAGEAKEIGKIIVTLDIEVIQANAAVINTAGWTLAPAA